MAASTVSAYVPFHLIFAFPRISGDWREMQKPAVADGLALNAVTFLESGGLGRSTQDDLTRSASVGPQNLWILTASQE